MSYTRTCNGKDCDAKLKWDDSKGCYVDEFFPNEKHDHAKYAAVKAYRTEESNEGHPAKEVPAGNTEISANVEGQECNKCKANGFPNEIIFFNNDAKSASGKVIPLHRPDKVAGEWVYHEHKEQGKEAPKYPVESKAHVNEPENAPVREAPKKEITPDNIADASPQEMAATMEKFANAAGELISKLSVLQPQVETIIGYILKNSVKRADQA